MIQAERVHQPAQGWRKVMLLIWRHRAYYVLMLPAIVYVAVFCYGPMYGLQIAFKHYKGSLGIAGSKWCGLTHFMSFFRSYNFPILMRNTIVLSIYSLIAGFPMPIVIALLLNETKGAFKRVSQMILYAPHFLSTVVVVGMLNTMLSPSFGIVNTIIEALGGKRIYFLTIPSAFRHLYVWSGVWQGMGWGAIIYLAALAAVDPELHEAATIDGASRIQRIRYINIPTIMPTIIILLIMRMGSLISVGYEKIYLLQNDLNVEVSEVISTYVYKRGILQTNYSFSTAVGLFNNVVNILVEEQTSLAMMSEVGDDYANEKRQLAQLLRYSVIVVSALPMLIIYPFLQKYFDQGVMIGSVKG